MRQRKPKEVDPGEPGFRLLLLCHKHGHDNERANTDQHDDSEYKALQLIVYMTTHYLSHIMRDRP